MKKASLFLLFLPHIRSFVVHHSKRTGNPPPGKHFSRCETTRYVGQNRDQRKYIGGLEQINDCTSATQARRILEREFLIDGKQSLYGSIVIPAGASSISISDGDLAIQTRLVNKRYSIIELIELSGSSDADRASLAILCATIGCTLSAIVANQNLPGPEILRFLVVWVLCFAPLFIVGYGIADAEKLQAILVSFQRIIFPSYRKRMIQHEAGHFLMAHLLGWPIAGYRSNAIKNAVEFYPLADIERGKELAKQLGFDKQTYPRIDIDSKKIVPSDQSFFSQQGRGAQQLEERSVFRPRNKDSTKMQLAKPLSDNDPTNAWPFRGFDDTTLDQLAVISVAGACSEILAFGNAEGGLADFDQLRQIFNSAETPLTEREIENRIRYALGYTISQLRRHIIVLDSLAEAMERGSTIAECVIAIEKCKDNVMQHASIGDFELDRRRTFTKQGSGLIERFFPYSRRSIDDPKDNLVEGVGGGDRKQALRLTGDDPIYAALAVSVLFFIYAASGGPF